MPGRMCPCETLCISDLEIGELSFDLQTQARDRAYTRYRPQRLFCRELFYCLTRFPVDCFENHTLGFLVLINRQTLIGR